MNILATFDSIVNTDLGLLYMIKDKYKNPDFIKIKLLDIPEKILIYELIKRKELNPLHFILKEDYIENADSLYNQFIDKEYESIISNSKINHISFILKLSSKSNIMSVNILCKNIYEEQFINNYNNKHNTKFNIVKYDTEVVDVEIYSGIFVKNYKDLLNFKNLIGKNIYVCNYKFNFVNDILLPEISLIVSDVNKISIIDSYKIDDSFKAIG